MTAIQLLAVLLATSVGASALETTVCNCTQAAHRENHIGETLRGLPNPITIWSVIIEESSGQRNAAPNDSSVEG